MRFHISKEAPGNLIKKEHVLDTKLASKYYKLNEEGAFIYRSSKGRWYVADHTSRTAQFLPVDVAACMILTSRLENSDGKLGDMYNELPMECDEFAPFKELVT